MYLDMWEGGTHHPMIVLCHSDCEWSVFLGLECQSIRIHRPIDISPRDLRSSCG